MPPMPRSSRAAVLNKAKTCDPGLRSSSFSAPLVTVANNRPSPSRASSTVASGPSNWISETVLERALLALSSCGGPSERTTSVALTITLASVPIGPAGPAIQMAPEECFNSVNPRAAFSPRTVVVSTDDRSKRSSVLWLATAPKASLGSPMNLTRPASMMTTHAASRTTSSIAC
jgi:hypothetical protein